MQQFDRISFHMMEYLRERFDVNDFDIEDESDEITAELIHDWEIRHGCTLPDDFIAFLKEFNGLSFEWYYTICNRRRNVAKVRIAPLRELVQVPLDNFTTTKKEIPQAAYCFEWNPSYGKVAFIYHKNNDTTPSPQVWFQDLACRWHFIAPSFTAYFRLVVVHLGISGWQYAYSDIGLDPVARQWMALFCPERLSMHDLEQQ